MKRIQNFLLVMITVSLIYSCEKDQARELNEVEEKKETVDQETNVDNSLKTYDDYEKFIIEGLVAYYPFNGDAKDHGPNKLDGKGSDLEFASDRFGADNGACSFDGEKSFIKIENSKEFNENAYTICFWYNPETTDTLLQTVLSKVDDSGFGYNYSIKSEEFLNKQYFSFKDKATTAKVTFGAGDWYRPSSDSDDKYYFVAVAFSETEFVNYLGGNSGTHSPAINFNNNTNDFFIGKSVSDEHKNFNGKIDDLLIYNRILTKDEVKTLSKWEKN